MEQMMIQVRKIAQAVDVWAALHRQELVDDLKGLIAIRSVSQPGEGGYAFGSGCKEALEYLLTLGRKYGFAVENDADHCLSILLPGQKGECELGLLGHLDVVPEGEGWKHDPFCAVEKDGYVIGRGSSDNKGPVLMALYVLRCMRELGYALKSDLRLIAGCDEECEMRDVQHYLQTHTPPAYTLNCDGAWALCIGEKGILTAEIVQRLEDDNLLDMGGGTASNMVPEEAWVKFAALSAEALARAHALCPGVETERDAQGITLRVRGAAAHCYVPNQGRNAIVKLLHLLDDARLLDQNAQEGVRRLLACFPDDYGTGLRIFHEDSASGKTTCVPSLLRMENGELILHINVRYAVTQQSRQLIAAMEKRLHKLGMRCQKITNDPPRYDSPDHPIVKMLLENCRELLGKQHKPYVMGGGTHSRRFPNSIPYGPLVLSAGQKQPFGEPHGPDEAVCVDQLLKAMKVYVMALMRLDEMLA